MRAYLLSDGDKKIIQKYLDEGLRLSGIDVLRHRIRSSLPAIREDLKLIEKFLGEAKEPEVEGIGDLKAGRG